jgi:hypothetical protein
MSEELTPSQIIEQERTRIDLDTFERKTARQYDRDMNKPELIRLVMACFERIDLLTDQLNARNELLSGTGEEGYLVTSPNKSYNGVSYSLRFTGGRAFVPDGLANAKHILRECKDAGYTLTRMTAADFRGLTPSGAPVRERTIADELMPVGRVGG